MQIVRRLYLYLAFLAGLAASVNGVIEALYALWPPGLTRSADVLAGGLASLLVGFPVMLGHWLWAQRLARAQMEERFSWVRAVALHLAWAVPWLIAFYQLLDLARQALWPYFMTPTMAFTSWQHGVLTVGVNGLVGAFFAYQNRQETGAAQRALWRLQGWLWTLQAVGLGSQGLYWIFSAWLTLETHFWPRGIVWTAAGGLLALILWPWWRRWRQADEERASAIHATLTLLVGLTGLTVVTLSSLDVLRNLFKAMWGLAPWDESLRAIGVLLLGRVLPWAGIAEFMRRAWKNIEAALPQPRGRLLRARAEGVAGLLGLAMTLMGLAMLWRAFWQAVLQGLGVQPWTQGLAFVLVGWPLWWVAWRSLQRDALENSTLGRAVRRSLGRRGLLYAGLLGSILTLMASLGSLVYHFLLLLLAGERWPLVEWLTMGGNGVLALGLGALLWSWLSQDHAWEADLERHQLLGFRVWLLSDGTSPLLGLLQERLRLLLPAMPVHWHDLSRGLPDPDQPVQAVVLLGHTLSALDDAWRLWMERFSGPKLVLPRGGPWVWVGSQEAASEALLESAVHHLRGLALGDALAAYERLSWRQALPAALGLLVWAMFWAGFLLG